MERSFRISCKNALMQLKIIYGILSRKFTANRFGEKWFTEATASAEY